MSRRDRRTVPLFDSLDPLRLLSGTVSTQIIAMHRKIQPLTNVHGDTVVTQVVPDVGRTIRLQGDAYVDGVGSVPFTGNLTATGFIARGRAGGSLVFAGTKGNMTVALTGPVQPGFASLPNRFSFRVTHADAEFAGFKGSGNATFSRDDSGHFAINFQPGLAKRPG